MKKHLLLIVILLFIINCSEKKTSINGAEVIICPEKGLWDEKGVTIEFEEILEIDPDDYENIFFRGGQVIRTDSKSNIYISNDETCEIYKLDPSGKYLTKFLRKGQGPGETIELEFFFINNNDNIYIPVIDQNRIIVYDSDGNNIDNIKLNIDSRLDYNELMAKDNNILLFGVYGEDNYMFHIFDFKGNYLNSFGKYIPVDENNISFKIRSWFGYGNCSNYNNQIIYTNCAYDNKLYLYKDHKLDKIFKTNELISDAYITNTSSNQKMLPKFNNSWRNRDGSFTGLNFVKSSRSIIACPDGKIYHFYNELNNKSDRRKGQKKYIEIFDSKMKYLGCFENKSQYYRFEHIDNDGYFYAHKYVNKKLTFVKLKLITNHKEK